MSKKLFVKKFDLKDGINDFQENITADLDKFGYVKNGDVVIEYTGYTAFIYASCTLKAPVHSNTGREPGNEDD